jgi:hypothetical protein
MQSAFAKGAAAVALVALGWVVSGMSNSTAQAPEAAPARTRWEYDVQDGTAVNRAMLSRMGDGGWELVLVAEAPGPTYSAVFKRPK